MTLKRKLVIAAVLVVVLAAVLLLGDISQPEVGVTFLRYEGADGIALQITNRSHSSISYVTWHSDPHGTVSPEILADGVLKAHWGRQVVIPVTGPHAKAGLVYVRNSLRDRIEHFCCRMASTLGGGRT